MTLPRPLASAAGLHGVRAFRHRNYRLFFGGQLVSLVGTWMQGVAQSWLVLQLTGDPFLLGVVAAAQFAPVLVLGLFGGLVADQLPKRQTMYVTQSFAMLLSFVMFLLTVTHTVQVWHVLAIALLIGVRNAVDMPVRQSFAVEMVGREDVQSAVALNSAMFNGARILGPAVAGLVIGAFGVPLAFLIDSLSFLAVLLGLWLMDPTELRTPPQNPRPTSARGVFDNLAEGVAYVRDTPLVLLAMAVVGLVSTVAMNFTVLVPPLARDVLHSDASGYGFLMSASGLGSLVAALAIAFSGRARSVAIVAGAALLGVAEIASGLSRAFPLTLVAMLFVGVGGITMAATANTVIQLSVPDRLRGRVMSVYTTVFAGSTPVGGLVMGAIAGSAGVAVALVIGGALSVVIAIVGWLSIVRGAVPGSVPQSRGGSVHVPPSLAAASTPGSASAAAPLGRPKA